MNVSPTSSPMKVAPANNVAMALVEHKLTVLTNSQLSCVSDIEKLQRTCDTLQQLLIGTMKHVEVLEKLNKEADETWKKQRDLDVEKRLNQLEKRMTDLENTRVSDLTKWSIGNAKTTLDVQHTLDFVAHSQVIRDETMKEITERIQTLERKAWISPDITKNLEPPSEHYNDDPMMGKTDDYMHTDPLFFF